MQLIYGRAHIVDSSCCQVKEGTVGISLARAFVLEGLRLGSPNLKSKCLWYYSY